MLQVRVCSCPKRDKDKAEKEFQQEGIKSATVLVGKKRKNDTTTAVDLKEYRIGCKVIGKQNYIKVLEYAADLMRSEAYLHGPTAEANYKRVLTELTNQLSKCVCFFLTVINLVDKSKESNFIYYFLLTKTVNNKNIFFI